MARFEIRTALPGDEPGLLHIARHLNSVNLPDDEASIHEIVELSYKSFSGEIQNLRKRQYVFVLVDRRPDDGSAERIVGTSMIIAQLGQRGGAVFLFRRP